MARARSKPLLDQKLIDACEQWHSLLARFNEICRTGFDLDDYYCGTVLPALDAIAKTPAITFNGMSAKAAVFRAYIAQDREDTHALVKSLCDDLLPPTQVQDAEDVQDAVIRHGRAA